MPDESKPQEADEKEHGDLDALLQKMYNERGYDFREYKRASVQRRINKRLFDNHLTSYKQYMELLDKDPGLAPIIGVGERRIQ